MKFVNIYPKRLTNFCVTFYRSIQNGSNIIGKRGHHSILLFFLLVGGMMLFSSCEEKESGAPPIIDYVRIIARDSMTHSGDRYEYYAIIGQNLASTTEVYFSGVKAALNATMVRDDNIIISIPGGAPFPGPNTLSTVKVITLFGEAQLEFEIEQPVADIQNFSPAVAVAGEKVVITGAYFKGLEKVSFVDAVTDVATDAEVTSYVVDEVTGAEVITVVVPEGIGVSYIAVTTASGTGYSASTFGFNYSVFTDGVPEGWNQAGWSGTTVWDNGEPVKSGLYSAKHSYTGGWGGFQITHEGFSLAPYTTLKVSLYGGPNTEGKLTQIYITETPGGPSTPFELVLHEGIWTDYEIPLSAIGNPAQVSELVIQDKGQAPYIMFVDDLGFI